MYIARSDPTQQRGEEGGGVGGSRNDINTSKYNQLVEALLLGWLLEINYDYAYVVSASFSNS